jgi:hypothetical protein
MIIRDDEVKGRLVVVVVAAGNGSRSGVWCRVGFQTIVEKAWKMCPDPEGPRNGNPNNKNAPTYLAGRMLKTVVEPKAVSASMPLLLRSERSF